ncbi:MAG: spondin domain-containing protein [Myxococcota bacterium]
MTPRTFNGAGLSGLLATTLAFAACGDDESSATRFRVRVENQGPAFTLAQSGAFAIPVGAAEAGPIGPDGAYEMTFLGAPGQRFSFATMFVPSNDLFYAPDGEGIALFDAEGNPVTGDVTAQVELWDAGTEVDQEPGTGMDQVQRQGGAGAGAMDPNTNVRLAEDAFGNLPDVADVIEVTLAAEDLGNYWQFTARIANVSTPNTLTTTADTQAVPLSPGVFAVHGGSDPLFTVGSPDRGEGLEAIAEDGTPTDLAAALDAVTGITLVASPGVWAVTEEGTDLFKLGETDRGDGLEAIAEDGSPGALAAAVGDALPGAGIFNTPDGAADPGPIGPGGAYEFEVEGLPGQYLHVVTMFVPSNDWLFTFPQVGLSLFDGADPVSGDVSNRLFTIDLGTEVDQPVGFGLDQVQFQSGPDTGAADPNTTVREVTDQPAASSILRVTVTPL